MCSKRRRAMAAGDRGRRSERETVIGGRGTGVRGGERREDEGGCDTNGGRGNRGAGEHGVVNEGAGETWIKGRWAGTGE